MQFTLLSRAYCSLCSAMQDELAEMIGPGVASVRVLDVDAFPELVSRWGDLVPVLFAGTVDPARELCHYHLDRAAVARALESAAATPAAVAAGPRIG